jgi:hypothetical protein
VTPGDILNPTAEIFEIPEHEWVLDPNQSAALARFRAATGERWTVRRMKADSVAWWSVERDEQAIIDLALSTALRKAREERQS